MDLRTKGSTRSSSARLMAWTGTQGSSSWAARGMSRPPDTASWSHWGTPSRRRSGPRTPSRTPLTPGRSPRRTCGSART